MSNKLFKTAINGYSKTEVDEYALHISRKTELLKKEYEKKLEVLEVENRKLRSENKQISDKLKEDEAIITAFRAKITVETDTSDYKTENIEKETEADENEILQKSKRYDEISRQLGEIIANANADAAAVKREAAEQAEKIIEDARSQAYVIKTTAISEIKNVTLALTEQLNVITESAESALNEKTAE